jgi:TPR repeat protein
MRVPVWAVFLAFACMTMVAVGIALPAQAGLFVKAPEKLPRYVTPASNTRAAERTAEIQAMMDKAKAGDVDAQFQLALLGLTGKLGANNAPEAVRLLGAAANSGHAEARFLLATLFLHGRGGVVKDEARAIRLYREQAEAGDARAQNALGQMLLHGQGGPKNAAEAVGWFRRAAEQKLAAAQSNLGYAYAHGEGIAPDKRKALEYFSMAAEQGVVGAQHNVAWMYQHGEGTATDLPKAFEWYRKASDAGYAKSQFNLGLALLAYAKENEQARSRDNLIEAVKWLTLAAAGRDPSVKTQAREALHKIAPGIGPELVAEAGEAARMWHWQRGR